MSDASIDPRWPRLLGLAVHEFRTPITVVAGYIRMLLKERAGPVSDAQRKLLEEAEKSCGRLSALVSEMSDLSALEGGTASLNSGTVDLSAMLRDVVAGLPPLPDREVAIDLQADGEIRVLADATRLRSALASILLALRREVVSSDRLVVQVGSCDDHGRPCGKVVIGDPQAFDGSTQPDGAPPEPFDEWRGGSGLSLAVARRIIAQHGGTLHGGINGQRTAAVIVLPRA